MQRSKVRPTLWTQAGQRWNEKVCTLGAASDRPLHVESPHDKRRKRKHAASECRKEVRTRVTEHRDSPAFHHASPTHDASRRSQGIATSPTHGQCPSAVEQRPSTGRLPSTKLGRLRRRDDWNSIGGKQHRHARSTICPHQHHGRCSIRGNLKGDRALAAWPTHGQACCPGLAHACEPDLPRGAFELNEA